MASSQQGGAAMTLSRRDVFTRGSALGIGVAGLPFASDTLAAPRRQGENNKVIFVTHDDNPFFVPVRAGLEQFGELAGWETQWIGPPKHDAMATRILGSPTSGRSSSRRES